MTCEPCRIVWARPERLEIYDHHKQRGVLLHESFASLQQSAGLGCQLCLLLLEHTIAAVSGEARNRHHDLILPESSLFQLHVGIHTTGAQTNHHSGSSTLLAQFEVKSRYGKKRAALFKHNWKGFLEVAIDRSVQNKVLERVILGRQIAEDPTSDESISIIRDWLSNCAEHESCKVRLTDVRPPSRTIDVGPSDGSIEPRLCVHSGSKDASFEWIALSHRWGGGMPTKTEKSNLEIHQRAIPMKRLPQTFYDAVIITRKLGLRHLWIDSLCIIQDDANDWKQEYPRMGSIYEQAYLTLAADRATDCHAGLLSPRTSEVVFSFPWTNNGTSHQVYLRKGLKAWKYALGERESYLHNRGWILQEELLSQRTLHFGRQQMFWECRTHLQSESLGEPFRNFTALNLTSGKSLMRLENAHSSKRTAGSPDLVVYLDWAVIIRDYTRRELSYASDKLPALVGAAQAFQRRLSPPARGYFAGMWGNALHKDLLWRGKYGGTLKPVPGRAPSWSWASVDGAILFPRHLGPALSGYIAEFIRDEQWPFHAPDHAHESQSYALTVSSLFIAATEYDGISNKMPPGYGDNGIRLTRQDDSLEDVLCYFDVRNEHTERLKIDRTSLAFLCISKFIEGAGQPSFVGLMLNTLGSGRYQRVGTFKLERDDDTLVRADWRHEDLLRGWTKHEVQVA